MSERERDILKARSFAEIDRLKDPMLELSERLGDHPEVAFEESKAVQWVSDVFQQMGFTVEKPFAGLETAFRARLVGRQEGPNMGFLVEYDALPDLGHACGHNTKGSSTWGAVAGILAALPDLPGTITVIGTPAEESGGGKVIMDENGAFDDLDVALALSVGPNNMTGLATLASQGIELTFHGRPAHAHARPEDGRNALRACIATFSLIDGLRQQFTSDVRINGIIVEGGQSPGIIPARAVAAFNVSCLDGDQQQELVEQVRSCAAAAAQANGCTVDYDLRLLYREMKLNEPLIELIESKMREIGLEVSTPNFGGGTGATDVGNVSQTVPIDSVWIGMGPDLMPHTPAYREACRADVGHLAIMNGARVGALCGLEIFTSPETLAAIRQDFAA